MLNSLDLKSKPLCCYLAFLLGLFLPISTAATNLWILLAALLGLVGGRAQLLPMLKRQPIAWVSLGLFLLLAISVFRGDLVVGFEYLMKYKKLVFIPFLALFFVQNSQRLWFLLYGFIAGNSIILLASMVIWFFGIVDVANNNHVGFVLNGNQYIAASVMKNAIAQSLLMSIAAFFAAALAIERRNKLLYVLIALMILNIFLMSPQRTGYLAVLLMAIWAAWLWLGWRTRLVCLFAIILAGSALWLGNTTPALRIEQGFSEVQSCLQVINTPSQDSVCATSLGLRTFWYVTAVNQIAEQPLLGYGTGNFSVPKLGVFEFTNPHNEYLMQGLQLGLVGIALYFALLVVGWCAAMRLVDPWRTVLSGVFIAYAVCSLFNSFLLDFTEGYTLVTLLAVLLAKKIELTSLSVKATHV